MVLYNLHTHKFTNDSQVVELVNQYPWEFNPSIPVYSIGIHPWHLVENRVVKDLKIIDKKLSQLNCKALGECGLDKRIDTPIELQIAVFKEQIKLAEKHRKPLLLHMVSAFQELIKLKKQMNISVPIIIHGFSKNEQLAKQLINQGFYLSFGKYLLRNPELGKVFKQIPDNRFFLETDTINESLLDVYQKAANYKNKSVYELSQLVENNWNTVFENKK